MGSDLLCSPFPCSSSLASQRPTAFPLTNRNPSVQLSAVGSPSSRSLHLVSSLTTQAQQSQLTENKNRRSGNYQPSLWNFEFLHSPQTDLPVETLEERASELEEEVRSMISRQDAEPIRLLELIDNIQRLGLTYKFEQDINTAIHRIVSSNNSTHRTEKKSLHAAALTFRLLRQHGFHISQDVFESFMDDEGKFKSEIKNDVEGLLSLYEASHLAFEGESVLDEAKDFARTHLGNILKESLTEERVREQVNHALELPYHQRLHRLEARRYIDTCEHHMKKPQNHSLLELAKLDFNRVQSLHQQELQAMLRWWNEIGLASKLSFARDRLMESFFWAVGMVPQPQFRKCRQEIAKVFALVTVIDDVYDVFGTLDELELFTDAVERWDVNAIDTLPYYMKLCFLALYNTVNDTAYDILKEKEENSLPYLTKAWSDLCKAFLREAKWSKDKVTPRFEEYIENGWLSSSGGVHLVHSYFFLTQDLNQEALHSLANYHHVLRSPSTIFRLANDLVTSKDESEILGETANSIACYMHENGVWEEQARDMLRNLIDKAWKKMNQDLVLDSNSVFTKPFIETAMNLARIAQCAYQYGDGHGRPDNKSNSRIKLLLVEPIPIHVTQ